MSRIVPTVLAADAEAFTAQIERVASLSDRIQIDLMDGEFAPTKSLNPALVRWPETVSQIDIHLMFARPVEQLETLISLGPQLVILHAEADGDIKGCLAHFQKVGIKAGVALLKDTSVESTRDLILAADHVLLFAGNLGSFGGEADLSVLDKVTQIRALKSDIEIGWDGGANETNIVQLSAGGIDVINVGSAIQQADEPASTYAALEALAENR